jgi:hypothetical protein
MEPEGSLLHSQDPEVLRPVRMVHNTIRFDSEESLAPYPTLKLEDYPFSSVCNCLFNIFTATLHIGGCSPAVT